MLPLFLLLLCRSAASSQSEPAAIFTVGHARFTFLSASFLRLEWSSSSIFEDRPTLSIAHRSALQPAPAVTRTALNATAVELRSSHVTLVYDDASGQPFEASSLRISGLTDLGELHWAPGAVQANNLNGTYTSLDAYSDPMTAIEEYENGTGPGWTFGMQPGPLARDGWGLHDDTFAREW